MVKLGLLLTALALECHALSATPSTWMIESIIARKQGIVSSGASSSTLEVGVLGLALDAWLDRYPHDEAAQNISSYRDQVLSSISATFTNATAAAALVPLDRLTVGQDLIRHGSNLTASEATALSVLNSSLSLQRRNQDDGLWYYVYPEWSYLDGTVSFLPFMAESPGWSRADALLQIDLLYSHCFDNSTGLAVHGYDASKTAVWANPVTGASPYVWGRSLGWYLAGLVNAWEALVKQKDCTDKDLPRLLASIKKQANTLVSSLVKYADPETGAWWQMPTFVAREGNYLESSSTALFVFSLLKGVRVGLLKDASVTHTALRAYDYTKNNFAVEKEDGTLGYNGTVSVCSLNSTATYEYYVTRALVPDSLLGEAAFVLASLEVERL